MTNDTFRPAAAAGLTLALLAPISAARAGSGDLGPPPGVDAGDVVAAQILLSNGTFDAEADVFPLGMPDGMLTQDDVDTILEASLGNITIPGDGGDGDRLLFYSASIHAVDPADLGTPITVDANPTLSSSDFSGFLVPGGTWDTSGAIPTVTNFENRYVFYNRSDGTLWRVSTEKVDDPMPERLSSESDSDICDLEVGLDFVDVLDTRIVYENAGADDDCASEGDNTWRFVRLGDGSGVAPGTAPGDPVTGAIIDPATGDHDGWIVVEAGRINVYNADFSSSTDVGAGTNVDLLGGFTTGELFLNVDGELRIYDTAAGTLGDSIHTFGFQPFGAPFARPLRSTEDADTFFFLDANPALSLFSADADGTVQTLNTPADAAAGFFLQAAFATLALSDTRVAFAYPTNTLPPVTKLVSVAKAGGAATTLDEGSLFFAGFTAPVSGAGGHVFYTESPDPDGDPTRVDALAAPIAGGTPVRFTDAFWIGSDRTFFDSLGSDDIASTTRVLVADGITNAADMAGASVLSVAASDPGGDQLTLGTIPGDVDILLFFGGDGTDRLASGSMGEGDDLTRDILYADTATADSLQRVTSTPGTDEFPLFGF